MEMFLIEWPEIAIALECVRTNKEANVNGVE